jgi:hypothetical protein
MKTFEQLMKKALDGVSFPPITEDQDRNKELTDRINLLAYEEELPIRAQDRTFYKEIKEDDDKERVIQLRIKHIRRGDDIKKSVYSLFLINYFDKNKKRAHYVRKSPFIDKWEAKNQGYYLIDDVKEEENLLEKDDSDEEINEVMEGMEVLEIEDDGEESREEKVDIINPFGIEQPVHRELYESFSKMNDGDVDMKTVMHYAILIENERDKVQEYVCGIKSPYNKKTIMIMMLIAGATAASALMFANHIHSNQLVVDDDSNVTTLSPSMSNDTVSPTPEDTSSHTDRVTLSPTQQYITHSPTLFNSLSPTRVPTVSPTADPTPSHDPDPRCIDTNANPACCDIETREWRCV